MAEATPDAKRLVNAYEDIWNERDYAKIQDVVSESFVMYDPAAPGGEVHGRDGLETFIDEVVSAFPDFRVTVIDMLVGEDTVMDEAKYTMTHEGEFDGIPPTGKEVEIRGMSIHRIQDGKVEEHRVYINQQELLDQLGLTED